VKKGMPFRQAHHAVGAVVAFAEKSGKQLDQVTIGEFRVISPQFGPDVKNVFNLPKAMQRRTLTGAPGTREVRKQLAKWKRLLS